MLKVSKAPPIVFLLTAVFIALITDSCAGGAREKPESAYFVNPRGKDRQSGLSEKKAFKTITHAVETAVLSDIKLIIISGDISAPVHLRPPASGSSASDEITLRGGTKGGRIVSRRADTAALRISGNLQIRLENLEITGGGGLTGGGVLAEDAVSVTFGPGALVRGNSADTGGGVYFRSIGDCIVDGGSIVENTAKSGGGIFFTAVPTAPGSAAFSRFFMSAGYVTGNSADLGGGILIYSPALQAGTYRLEGGSISGNTGADGGGGVLFTGPANTLGTLELGGSEIARNSAAQGGGLMFINGAFSFTSGSVRENSAAEDGGGIFYDSPVVSTLSGGTVTANKAGNRGGGLVVVQGQVAMKGGIIASNRAKAGGGVYVLSDGLFMKQGGVLYGKDGSSAGADNANRADSRGDAAYKDAGYSHERSTTVPESEYFSSVNVAGWN